MQDQSPYCTHSTTSLNVFGGRQRKAKDADEAERMAGIWQGDWVCSDCGYIYNRDEGAGFFFEEQGSGFRCPQCSGPKRRYAKKVGTTLDGGDGPILLFSFGGLALTNTLGIWAMENI